MNDISDIMGFVGKSFVDEDLLSVPHCRRVAALLDNDPAAIIEGSAAPLGWTTTLFGPLAPTSALGEDGHPARGEFLPPVPLPRRMMAGRTLTLHAPVRVGDLVTRHCSIDAIEEKQGRSGPLVFVTVRYELSCRGEPCITEMQRIVYRDHAPAEEGGRKVPPAPFAAAWSETRTPDEAALFRCSAIGFNAHRIHYDRDYCRAVENYPDLVVNASLTTLLLLGLAERSIDFSPVSFSTRAVAPLFVNQPIRLCGAKTDSGAFFWAENDRGDQAMTIDIRR